jgi:hypothetical protein
MPILLAPLVALLLAGAPAPAADTAVVCPSEYRGALVPWLEYRAGQGHHIVVVDADGTFQQVRDRLRPLARGGRLRFVLLVGHAHAAPWPGGPGVPTAYVPAKVNVLWGSEKEIATDGPYGDLDGDGTPELAVGRWPVASPAETSAAVRKVLAYEESTEGGDWQRRISFVAGTSGVGAVPDAALEMAARTLLSQYIPPAYVSSMTYASWRSPYCPEPGLFQAMAVERFNEGCLFWVFLGHGQRQYVDYVHVPQGYYPILDRRSAAGLSSRTAPPIALLLACYTGAYDWHDECLAETLFKTPGGPVAVMASSRVSMPYGMSVLGIELMREYFTHRRPTLGELQLAAKRATLDRSHGDATNLLLDTLARVVNPRGTELAAERAEHVALFNLLGDPLLRLKHAQRATVTTSAGNGPQDELLVSVASPVDGRGKVEIVVRRDRLTFEPPERKSFEPWAHVAENQEVYNRANDSRLAWTVMDVRGGRATVRVRLPEAAVGPCHVRVFVRDEQGNCALGSSDVVLPKHEPTANRAANRPAGRASKSLAR